jgi:hypothetical protein
VNAIEKLAVSLEQAFTDAQARGSVGPDGVHARPHGHSRWSVCRLPSRRSGE